MPETTITRVIETALYCDDLRVARHFYEQVLGFTMMLESPRLVALNVGGDSVLLLFQRGLSEEAEEGPRGTVPGHGASGPQHVAFAITLTSRQAWLDRLTMAGVAIESTVRWPRGGESLYFRDPDGHSVELLTERSWPIY